MLPGLRELTVVVLSAVLALSGALFIRGGLHASDVLTLLGSVGGALLGALIAVKGAIAADQARRRTDGAERRVTATAMIRDLRASFEPLLTIEQVREGDEDTAAIGLQILDRRLLAAREVATDLRSALTSPDPIILRALADIREGVAGTSRAAEQARFLVSVSSNNPGVTQHALLDIASSHGHMVTALDAALGRLTGHGLA